MREGLEPPPDTEARRAAGAPRGRRDGFLLVAVLWAGVALLLLATASSTLAWMHWSGARHAAATLQVRADAEGALLRLERALDASVAAGAPLPNVPPPVPPVEGIDARVVTFRPLAGGAFEMEVEVVRGPARAVAGGLWIPR